MRRYTSQSVRSGRLSAPVVLEPLFNHFEPLRDERLVSELRVIADKAGVPIRQVLVADASKRTSKSNAYVSGLGATRRVVVWDTLLEKAGFEVRATLGDYHGTAWDKRAEVWIVLATRP